MRRGKDLRRDKVSLRDVVMPVMVQRPTFIDVHRTWRAVKNCSKLGRSESALLVSAKRLARARDANFVLSFRLGADFVVSYLAVVIEFKREIKLNMDECHFYFLVQ